METLHGHERRTDQYIRIYLRFDILAAAWFRVGSEICDGQEEVIWIEAFASIAAALEEDLTGRRSFMHSRSEIELWVIFPTGYMRIRDMVRYSW